MPNSDAEAPVDQLLISAVEVSRLLGVSTRSLWRYLGAGHIPKPVRFGGSVRWRSADVRQWIADGCPVPGGEKRD